MKTLFAIIELMYIKYFWILKIFAFSRLIYSNKKFNIYDSEMYYEIKCTHINPRIHLTK